MRSCKKSACGRFFYVGLLRVRSALRRAGRRRNNLFERTHLRRIIDQLLKAFIGKRHQHGPACRCRKIEIAQRPLVDTGPFIEMQIAVLQSLVTGLLRQHFLRMDTQFKRWPCPGNAAAGQQIR